MDHTIALIQKTHQGDEQAKAQLVEENVGLVWCVVRRFFNRGAEAGGSVSDWKHRTVEGN